MRRCLEHDKDPTLGPYRWLVIIFVSSLGFLLYVRKRRDVHSIYSSVGSLALPLARVFLALSHRCSLRSPPALRFTVSDTSWQSSVARAFTSPGPRFFFLFLILSSFVRPRVWDSAGLVVVSDVWMCTLIALRHLLVTRYQLCPVHVVQYTPSEQYTAWITEALAVFAQCKVSKCANITFSDISSPANSQNWNWRVIFTFRTNKYSPESFVHLSRFKGR